MRKRLVLSAHQQLSPALEDKLAYFATVTGSYEAAAKLATKVGNPVEDSTVRALVQRLGSRAEPQTSERFKEVPAEKFSQRPATNLAVLLLDAYLVRFRGTGWGKNRTQPPRVQWHEEKLGVFYAQEQSIGSEQGELLDKVVVGWQGEPLEVGRRLHWEALRHGLGRARSVLALADGAPWIWSMVKDRWSHAHHLLDFYRASQHLWSLGEALHPKNQLTHRQWVESQLHQLRRGKEKRVLQQIAACRAEAVNQAK